MSKYPQGAFRNAREERVFHTIRQTLRWCAEFAEANSFPHRILGEVYHNVRTIDFHGELSARDTFADPQSREIDVLLELERPQNIRLLGSVKDSDHRQSLEHIGDYEALLTALRSHSQGWLYWAMVVARKGFQSGCEETAKRVDIALVPPITGDTEWLSVITEEEVLERVEDAVKVFTLGESWQRDASSYAKGDVYNAVYVATREPSGMPGSTRIRQGDGTERPMRDFIREAMAKPENRFRIPLSRQRTYVPLMDPPTVQSVTRDGSVVSSRVASTIVASAAGLRFFRVRTETGRELIADGQRALYTVDCDHQGRRLVRVDRLKVGTPLLCAKDDGTGSQLEKVTLIEPVEPE